MKTAFALCALFFACLLSTTKAITLGASIGTDSTNSPLTLTPSTGTAVSVTPSAAGTLTAATGTAYTGRWTAGFPLTQTLTLTNEGTAAAFTAAITFTLGPQVSVSVSACTNVAAAGSACSSYTATSASAAALTASSTCGSYILDCAAGTLQVAFNAAQGAAAANPNPATNGYCVVQIVQIPAVVGGLAYATAPSTAAQTAILQAITTQSGATGSVAWCGTTTSSGNTVYMFVQQLTSSSTAADVTTAQNKLLTAIRAKTAFTGNARLLEESSGRMLATYTLVQGYSTGLTPVAGAGFTAPSAAVTSNLATANAVSANRVVVAAGILTTIVAGFFGLAL